MTTFGIDLGTTCSAIGWVRDGQAQLLDQGGSVLLPSVVLYPETGPVLVGEAAENLGVLHPDRLFRSTKRDMGTSRRWNVDGAEIGPVDVAEHILRALCARAEEITGEKPHDVVISIPAWFQQGARGDTRQAAEQAGLNVVRLVNEPTAAALAHANGKPQDRIALVFDLGGGTFDVSIVDQQGELVEVLASRGDARLGGDDLDDRLLQLALDHLRADDPELAAAAAAQPDALEKLTRALREAKHALSTDLKTVVRVPFLIELEGKPHHLELALDRDALNESLKPLVDRALACVADVLADAKLSSKDIDQVLLVGGATQSPLVWEALHGTYGWEASSAIPPQEAVALGAALQGALIDGVEIGPQLLDVASHPIGVAAMHNGPDLVTYVSNATILPRNSPLPGRHTHRFGTGEKEQPMVVLTILQGSERNPLRNLILGKLIIDKLPPAPPGQNTRPIAVEISHDASGMVSVRMIDELSGRSVEKVLVASGEDAREVREAAMQAWKETGLVPGDGRDPDPYLENEQALDPGATPASKDPEEQRSATDSTSPATTGDSDSSSDGGKLADASAAFASVLKHAEMLASEHPDHAPRLTQLATDGQAAIAGGQDAIALALHDQLADLQFGLGIYL